MTCQHCRGTTFVTRSLCCEAEGDRCSACGDRTRVRVTCADCGTRVYPAGSMEPVFREIFQDFFPKPNAVDTYEERDR